MKFFELLLTALALAMDTFAVSIVLGIGLQKKEIKKGLISSLYFGGFQAGMVVIGFYFAILFKDKIISFDHWVAFILLGIIGGKMIVESLKKEKCQDRVCPKEKCIDRECPKKVEKVSFGPRKMLPLAVATSIDAMAIGITFSLISVNIVSAFSIIGGVTFVISFIGIVIGNVFGGKFKNNAEIIGGIILVLIGLKILLEHLQIIKF